MKRLSTMMVLALSFQMVSAIAATPQLKTQAPGFYRMMLGDDEITVLFDGFFPMKPKEVLTHVNPKKADALLARSRQGDLIPTSVNAFLVNTGSKLVLIDAGCGTFFGPALGQVLENLKASGYKPEQIDEVVITHMHADHLSGITRDGKAVFPNAVVRMDQRDADFWLKPENGKNLDKQIASMINAAIVAVAPYKAADKFKPFQGETEIVPGIKAISAYGHTPGHTVYAVESKGKKLLLVGDLFHVEAIQFADPSISLVYDSDPKEAAIQREKIFKEAAQQDYLLGAAHLPFPGIGHVTKDKPGFRYLPIPYAPL